MNFLFFFLLDYHFSTIPPIILLYIHTLNESAKNATKGEGGGEGVLKSSNSHTNYFIQITLINSIYIFYCTIKAICLMLSTVKRKKEKNTKLLSWLVNHLKGSNSSPHIDNNNNKISHIQQHKNLANIAPFKVIVLLLLNYFFFILLQSSLSVSP